MFTQRVYGAPAGRLRLPAGALSFYFFKSTLYYFSRMLFAMKIYIPKQTQSLVQSPPTTFSDELLQRYTKVVQDHILEELNTLQFQDIDEYDMHYWKAKIPTGTRHIRLTATKHRVISPTNRVLVSLHYDIQHPSKSWIYFPPVFKIRR